jgi:hypothetical protein
LDPAKPREFIEVSTQVRERWHEQEQRDAAERYFARLMHKYNVVIEDSVKSQIGPIGMAQVHEAPR